MADAKPKGLKLTLEERASPLWRKIEAEMNRRIAANRVNNDNPLHDEAKTAAIRGAIAELKLLLKMGAESQDISTPPPHDA